jgi:hypothetical protein
MNSEKQNWGVVPLTDTESEVTKHTEISKYKGFWKLTQL